MLDKVEAALGAIRAEGTFATTLTCGSEALKIEVDGVGPLRFPISAATAHKLCGAAHPAPFGLREKTHYDTSVRDTWQLDRKRVKIDTRRWQRALQASLSVIQRRLGLPDEGRLEAIFDKMLIYGPGQFFAPHKDSERSDDMIGTLTVELPSQYSGGAIVVEHGAKKKVSCGPKQGKKELSLLAFYADCIHEVRPVKSGYRIVLTYELRYHRASRGQEPSPSPAAVSRLSACIRSYFDEPVPEPYSGSAPQKPDRLIFLLDHEYTQKSLAWERLKNSDRLRAAALRQVAEQLDCEIYLALADVHETWSYEEEDWNGGYGYGRRRSQEDLDEGEVECANVEADANDEDYELLEMIDSDLELHHFIGSDGKTAPSIAAAPGPAEVCDTLPSREMKPFKSEYEGWMGNYGNTLERWYHRAAVVMWPRERNFVIRAKMSPEWALGQLLAQLKAGASSKAAEQARSLLPFWKWAVPRNASATFFEKLLKILDALSDAELALALLSPLGPHGLSPRTLPAFVTLAKRHGLPWAKQVFCAWAEAPHYDEPWWVSLLPHLCAELVAAQTEPERALATWLLEQEVSTFEQRHKNILLAPRERLVARELTRHHAALLALFESAQVLMARSIRARLLTFLLAPATAMPLMSAGEFLRVCQKNRTPSAVRALGLGPLYHHVVDDLERILTVPERSRSDWSIELSNSCKCKLCAELSEFLRDPNRIELAWPLAEDKRRHIHHVIDIHDLPVKHETSRHGRPYTLVLTKQPALFHRAATLRKKQQELLGWLQRQRAAFSDDMGCYP